MDVASFLKKLKEKAAAPGISNEAPLPSNDTNEAEGQDDEDVFSSSSDNTDREEGEDSSTVFHSSAKRSRRLGNEYKSTGNTGQHFTFTPLQILQTNAEAGGSTTSGIQPRRSAIPFAARTRALAATRSVGVKRGRVEECSAWRKTLLQQQQSLRRIQNPDAGTAASVGSGASSELKSVIPSVAAAAAPSISIDDLLSDRTVEADIDAILAIQPTTGPSAPHDSEKLSESIPEASSAETVPTSVDEKITPESSKVVGSAPTPSPTTETPKAKKSFFERAKELAKKK